MPNICKICRFPDQELVKTAFSSGATDRQLAQQFAVSRMAIARHRQNHLVRPMQAAMAALDKGRSARQQREQQLTAIEAGNPIAIASTLAAFSQEEQLKKIGVYEQGLMTLFKAAVANEQFAAAAQIGGQLLRANEVGSRTAQVGGYAAHVAGQPGGGVQQPVNQILMVFPNAGREESMTFTSGPADPSAPAGRPDHLIIEGLPASDEEMPEDQATLVPLEIDAPPAARRSTPA